MERAIRIESDIAFIPLNQGRESVIDAADVRLIDGGNWCAHTRNGIVYAVRNERLDNGKWRSVLLHRIIMGEPDGLQIDHRDCDGLNNRRGNLRIATHSQNQHNRRLNCNNTSGFKGVSWCKSVGKWWAKINVNRKQHSLGYFLTAEAAGAAYCAASHKMHGEFSRTE